MMRSLWLFLLLICAGLSHAQGAKNMLIIGDSLSTAYGINQDEGWVHLLKVRLQQEYPNVTLINESISGQTTAQGLAQLPRLLEKHTPAIVIIELGGNDGLQGLAIAHIKNNLQQMITLAQQANAKLLLLGMKLPPNYGMRYTDEFQQMFVTLAQDHQIALVPFLLEGVGGYIRYMQNDGIHPGKDAQQSILNNVWPYLPPLIQ